jgi:hypothetical protein
MYSLHTLINPEINSGLLHLEFIVSKDEQFHFVFTVHLSINIHSFNQRMHY